MGRQGGKQDISIGNGCERLGTVLHEMMHTIGFIHEQSRPDRDKYIKVFYDNIKPGEISNFFYHYLALGGITSLREPNLPWLNSMKNIFEVKGPYSIAMGILVIQKT